MQQLQVPFAEKLDEPLAELCNGGRGLTASSRVPVIVRYTGDSFAELTSQITRLGGTIRHQLAMVSALAAWLPLNAIQQIAQDSEVSRIELVDSFTVA